jgi:hypothetical protein
MIERMSDLPTGIIGFRVTGTMHAEDYRDVVIPAVEEAAAAGEVRFLIVIPEFKGFTPGALWQDLKVGVEHLRAWKKIALVTDIEWMIHLEAMFGWMTPGQVKCFSLADERAAIEWVSA